MDSFSISGKELSEFLQVDSSLVSKWRSGKRKIKINSPVMEQIVKYVMDLDGENQYARIRLILSQDYVNVFKSAENDIRLYLKDWLTSEKDNAENAAEYINEIKNLRNASKLTTYMLSGTHGRRKAVLFFLKYAQQISPGAEIYCYTTEDGSWFTDSEEFIEEWTMRNMTLMGENNKSRIIFPLSTSYESVTTSIFLWMPVLLTGQTEAYYIPKYTDNQLVFTYFLIKGHLAVYNWTSRQSAREINTYITHEPQFVKDVDVMLQCFIDESTRLFEKYDYPSSDAYINSVVAILERGSKEYHWMSFPIVDISEALMREILTVNGFVGEELEQYYEKLMVMGELSVKSSHCYFIDLELLKERLRDKVIVVNELSFACGRTIRLDRNLSVRLLRQSLDSIMSSENFKMCLASTDLLRRLHQTEIFAKENSKIQFSNTTIEPPCVLVTKELTLVTAVYNYFEQLWNTTPYICKNNEYIYKQIVKIIDETNN